MMAYSPERNRKRPLIVAAVVAFCAVAALALLTRHSDLKINRTTVREAYESCVAIAERAKWDALYHMFVRDIREKIAITHENIRRRVELIEKHFPDGLKRQALEDVGPEEVRNARSPEAYFAALVHSRGGVPLSFEYSLGSRPKKIEEDPKNPGRFRVTTLAGDVIEFVKGGDGQFELVPVPQDVQTIHREYLRSLEMLEATRRAVMTLGGTR